MEEVSSVWQIGIIALVAGAMIGVLAYRLLSPSVKQADDIKAELDAARKELSSYKDSVNQHFNKTSELVNDLTQDYVKVYQHLAEGAQTLGDSQTLNNLLEQRPGKVAIAVDEEIRSSERIVDTVVTPSAPEASVDEHAEPFTRETAAETGSPGSKTAAETDSPGSENDNSETGTVKTSDDTERADEAEKPVLNTDALDQAAEKTDNGARAEAAGKVAEDEEKPETRATTH